MNRRFAYRLLVVSVFLWCLLVLSPALFASLGTPYLPIATTLYHAFSPVCHQYDSHSLHIGGHKLAVCGRCTAIYIGFFLGVILYPLFGRNNRLNAIRSWIVGGLPMLIDVFVDLIGWHSATMPTRVITGGWFGVIAAIILVPVFVEAVKELFLHQPEPVVYESKT